jgi:hypothetical protein
VFIEQHYDFQQTGWAIGPCDGCCAFGVVRIENYLRVTTGFPFPASKQVIGEAAHCDFCGRELERSQVSTALALDRWTHSEGVEVLAARLGVVSPGKYPKAEEHRLHSLLANVEDVTHSRQISVTWAVQIGAPVGMFLGALVGYFTPPQIVGAIDAIGTVGLGAISGLFAGMILAAVIWTMLRPGYLARQRLRAAFCRYPFDAQHLQSLSSAYSERVRRAARRLNDDVSHRRLNCGRYLV